MRGGTKRPLLSDLRESGAIEQDADMVVFIHRQDKFGIPTFEDGSSTKGIAEIILAKIILEEKYRTDPSRSNLQFIPMMPDIDAMLAKADAALLVNEAPVVYNKSGVFTLDLVEEWNDLTDLPYVHGFWVGREEEMTEQEAKALLMAKNNGVLLQLQIAQEAAQQRNLPLGEITQYFSSFSYDLGEREQESLAEFIQYAYYHTVIGDVPEIRFFDVSSNLSSQN